MKYRNGFVSNSSSTSFVVAVNDSIPCPHCGRADLSIIDLVSNSSDGSGDTRLRWTDPKDYLIELEEEIEGYANDLRSYKDKDDNDLAGFRNTHKVSDMKLYAQASINDRLAKMQAVNQALVEGKRVISFEVDYHNDALNHVIKEQIKCKKLEVIEEHG